MVAVGHLQDLLFFRMLCSLIDVAGKEAWMDPTLACGGGGRVGAAAGGGAGCEAGACA